MLTLLQLSAISVQIAGEQLPCHPCDVIRTKCRGVFAGVNVRHQTLSDYKMVSSLNSLPICQQYSAYSLTLVLDDMCVNVLSYILHFLHHTDLLLTSTLHWYHYTTFCNIWNWPHSTLPPPHIFVLCHKGQFAIHWSQYLTLLTCPASSQLRIRIFTVCILRHVTPGTQDLVSSAALRILF